MAKLSRSFTTRSWKVKENGVGMTKYQGQFKEITGQVKSHERRDNGLIISLLSTRVNRMKGVVTRRKFSQKFAIEYGDILEEEVLSWHGKKITVLPSRITVS